MTARQWGLLGVLAILWGVSFLFSKVALAEVPPFTLVLGRFGLAALALLLAARLGGHRLPRSPRIWAGLLVLGALNGFIPFGLIAWGQVQLTSGLASILNATTPLFTALVAHAWGDERLTPNRLAGVLVGFAGVCVLFGPGALGHLGVHTLAELAILGAAVSYAFAGTYGRRFRALPPVVPVAGMMTGAAVLALPVSVVVDRPWTLAVGARTWGALLGLALLSTALGFVLYFRLLATAGATNVMLVTLLMPVVALALGGLILGETVTGTALAGMALIGAGLVAIDGRVLGTRRPGAARPRHPALSPSRGRGDAR
ncbi:MAG TPA: DMT family transporter [Methylomirabilota bacterium]|nr:DMT family transporter [Methylomirabilota bacterium]